MTIFERVEDGALGLGKLFVEVEERLVDVVPSSKICP